MNRVLSSADIEEIYRTFILPKERPAYLNKYRVLPMKLNDKQWRWEGKDFPRVIALLEFRDFIQSRNLEFDEALSFNGANDPEYEYVDVRMVHNYDYAIDQIRHDLHSLDLEKKDFDFFMANQTLEHVYDPCLVLRSVSEHMRNGGILYMNVPVINIPHSTPYHFYTGLTPVGLGCIVKQAGFEILDIGFWGNLEYHNYIFKKNDWPDYRKLKNYICEANRPVISWVFARKVCT